MEKEKLKRFAVKEFLQEAPPDVEFDGEAREKFIAANIDPVYLDKLLAEFCEMNPQEFAELKPFDFSKEVGEKLQDTLAAAAANGTLEEVKKELLKTIRYQQNINRAGLAYLCDTAAKYTAQMSKAAADAER